MDILNSLNIKKINSGASHNKHSWSTTTDAGLIESINPANNEVIASVHAASATDLEHIVRAAEHAFLKWREVPAPKRGEIIRQIGQVLRAKKTVLGSLISLETGKSKHEGEGEVQEMIDMADFSVGLSRALYGYTMPSERAQHRIYEQWYPLGPIGIISAFNFPVAVWAWNAFIAAICGNTVIWKPSSKTPLCAIAIQDICNEIMEENGYSGIFSLCITHDTKLADRFVDDTRIPLISFTGSSAVGNQVYKKIAGRMARCILECSGNNAVIVDDSADLNIAIPAITFGAIGTAGQRCTSIRRVFVHEAVEELFIHQLTNAYNKISIGDPLNEKYIMGPLIDEHAVNQFNDAINEVKRLNGKILFGGHVINKPGFYVEPTIIRAQNDWPIVQTETFAPILYLMTFKTIEEAVQLQNNARQGLSSAIFSSNLYHIEYFLSVNGSDCGLANVNISTSGAEIGAAFGGEKDTGGGREAGSDAWKTYMRRQTVTINWGKELTLAQGIPFKLS